METKLRSTQAKQSIKALLQGTATSRASRFIQNPGDSFSPIYTHTFCLQCIEIVLTLHGCVQIVFCMAVTPILNRVTAVSSLPHPRHGAGGDNDTHDTQTG